MEAIPASGSPLSLLRISSTLAGYFFHAIVYKCQIELKKGKIHGAQDQLPSQSHFRHVLFWNTRIHIFARET